VHDSQLKGVADGPLITPGQDYLCEASLPNIETEVSRHLHGRLKFEKCTGNAGVPKLTRAVERLF